MDRKEVLLREVEDAPDEVLDEVLDFVRFLKTKKVSERRETALASEAALKKEWLKPEEDEAWQDL